MGKRKVLLKMKLKTCQYPNSSEFLALVCQLIFAKKLDRLEALQSSPQSWREPAV